MPPIETVFFIPVIRFFYGVPRIGNFAVGTEVALPFYIAEVGSVQVPAYPIRLQGGIVVRKRIRVFYHKIIVRMILLVPNGAARISQI